MGIYTKYNFFFSVTALGRKVLDIGKIFQAITVRDFNERLNHTSQNTASGPDGIQREQIAGQDMREILRILLNMILVSKILPKTSNTNMILIPKQTKDGTGLKTRHITVRHKAIEGALKRLGLPKGMQESKMNSYATLSTSIEYAGSKTEVSLLRRVKQGNPISNFNFNAIMDPMLEQLNRFRDT